MKVTPKFKKEKTVLLSPLLLAACGGGSKETKTTPVLEFNTSDEPTVVILDYFQAGSTTHGPLVLQNFYGSFGNDYKEVTVIAEDVDHDKPNPLLRAYQDFQPDVINLSWGTTTNIQYPAIFYYDNFGEKSIEKEAVDTSLHLWENGTTITIAAGNYGTEGVVGPWGYSIFPIAVGAYLQFEDGNIADWSNTGGAVVHYYEMGDGWGHEGTSFSAPRVAGHVALIKHDNPGISESSVRTILEKNSIYETHNGDYIQKLDNITVMNPEIDISVRVEAMFEIFEGRNPSHEELSYWTELVTNQGLGLGEMALQYAINGIQFDNVPPIERMQAFYHFWLGRESEDNEIVEMLEDLGITKDWNKTFDNFIELENIDTNYSFVYNNYNELLSFDEVTYV
jgi:hypothetical protein